MGALLRLAFAGAQARTPAGRLRPIFAGLACQTESLSERQRRQGEVWTLRERIRTLAEIDVKFAVFTEEPFTYQEIGPKALELFRLGMNYSQIALQLKVTDKTVAKGIRYVERLEAASKPSYLKFSSPRRKRKDKARSNVSRIQFDEES